MNLETLFRKPLSRAYQNCYRYILHMANIKKLRVAAREKYCRGLKRGALLVKALPTAPPSDISDFKLSLLAETHSMDQSQLFISVPPSLSSFQEC